jgi:hypothetical protein
VERSAVIIGRKEHKPMTGEQLAPLTEQSDMPHKSDHHGPKERAASRARWDKPISSQ